MKRVFEAELHTPQLLTEQVSNLGPELVLVGSIGRCLVTEELKPLKRIDGTPSDLDVIDLTGNQTSFDAPTDGMFRLDCGMTRVFRPIVSGVDARWGLFLPGQAEVLIDLGEHDLLQPKDVSIAWDDRKRTARTLSPQVQSELLDIVGPYAKDPDHAARFKHEVHSKYPELPKDIRRDFDAYRHYKRSTKAAVANWKTDRLTQSVSESVYRQARHAFKEFTPVPLQQLVHSVIGSTVRTIRGTDDK